MLAGEIVDLSPNFLEASSSDVRRFGTLRGQTYRSPPRLPWGDFNSAVLKDAERASVPSVEGRMSLSHSDE